MAGRDRLFFALWPDADVRNKLGAAADRIPASAQAQRVRRDRLHLTLLFLGDMTPAQAAGIEYAAGGIAAAPFNLTIDEAGSFGNSVWWLGPSDLPPGLHALWGAVKSTMGATGMPFEPRPLAPHITFLRQADQPLGTHQIKPVEWPVTEFALVRSTLDKRAADYEVIGRWPLNAPAPEAAPEGAAELDPDEVERQAAKARKKARRMGK